MISYLNGQIKDVSTESITLLCGSVGYEVLVPLAALAEAQTRLMSATGAGGSKKDPKEFELWIYTHVREDQLTLFGFETKSDRNMFLTLLKVNGVGPKMALNMLSGAGAQALTDMIEAEDVKALTKIPKVGKKTAEQIILSLKGKLVITDRKSSAAQATLTAASPHKDLISALINLGFRPVDVEQAVSEFPVDIDLQEGLRRGLSLLSGIN